MSTAWNNSAWIQLKHNLNIQIWLILPECQRDRKAYCRSTTILWSTRVLSGKSFLSPHRCRCSIPWFLIKPEYNSNYCNEILFYVTRPPLSFCFLPCHPSCVEFSITFFCKTWDMRISFYFIYIYNIWVDIKLFHWVPKVPFSHVKYGFYSCIFLSEIWKVKCWTVKNVEVSS